MLGDAEPQSNPSTPDRMKSLRPLAACPTTWSAHSRRCSRIEQSCRVREITADSSFAHLVVVGLSDEDLQNSAGFASRRGREGGAPAMCLVVSARRIDSLVVPHATAPTSSTGS